MLYEFYGQECGFCHKMRPLVEKMEKELEITVEKFEVWHNEENNKKFQEFAAGICRGVPFFINTETKGVICGATDYETLKKWARGE